MNAPMILPWMARKWDVSNERALALWEEACQHAESVTGEHSSSRYWGIAKAEWIDLLDGEFLASYPVIETPWVLIQLTMKRFVARMKLQTGALGYGYSAI